MQLSAHFRSRWLDAAPAAGLPWLVWLGLAAAVALGFLLFSGILPEEHLPLILLGALAGLFLLRYPEIALVLLIKVGKYKGDDRLASLLPFDPTLVIWLLLAGVILYRLFRRELHLRFPPLYLLYLIFAAMMLLSLSYTPDFGWGLEKAGRFILFCGMAIVAPFFILDRPERLKRFLLAFVASAILMSLNALAALGKDRLVAPSGLTIQLGSEAAEAILILLFFVLPGLSFVKRLLCYPLILLLLVTLIGAGARGSSIALALCLPLLLLFHKSLRLDLFLLVAVAIPFLAVAPIPEASITYLASLLQPDPQAVLGFRYDLMSLGWKLVAENPIFGVGIGGYPSRSPNAALFNYPHNVFLEVSAEMGILSSALLVVLVAASFRESLRQVINRHFPLHKLSCVVLVLLVMGFVSIVSTGDITSNRSMWLYMTLPFVLRNLALRQESSNTVGLTLATRRA